MKKFLLSLFAAAFLLAATSAGQDLSAEPETGKAVVLSGQASEDGKHLLAKKGEPWSVVNPGALAGHEGQLVKVKCRISSRSREIRVLSVKAVARPLKYAANPGDSAFRR